jgi:hypothetical protein
MMHVMVFAAARHLSEKNKQKTKYILAYIETNVTPFCASSSSHGIYKFYQNVRKYLSLSFSISLSLSLSLFPSGFICPSCIA